MIKKDLIDFIYHNNIIKLGTVKLKNGDYSDHSYRFDKVDSPESLFHLSKWLVELVGDTIFDVVFTSAYKGIVLQAGFALDYSYQFPFKKIKFGYLRKEQKPHGEEGDVVGYQPKKGDKVLLLDDVFTTGYSFDEMSKFLKGLGAIPVLAIAAVLRADKKLLDKFQKNNNIPIRYLIHDNEITSVYKEYKG